MVATSKNEPNAVVSSKVEALYDSYPFPPGMCLSLSTFSRCVASVFSGRIPCCPSQNFYLSHSRTPFAPALFFSLLCPVDVSCLTCVSSVAIPSGTT